MKYQQLKTKCASQLIHLRFSARPVGRVGARGNFASTMDRDPTAGRAVQRGFTIVELLIVIVVIAILAAISIVAYTGIQRQATETALKSDLTQAGKQLALEQVKQGSYPGTDGSTTNGSPVLTPSSPTTFQYTRTGDNYCLTAVSSTDGVPAFHISNTNTTPTEGICPGHTGPSTGGGGGSTTLLSPTTPPSKTSPPPNAPPSQSLLVATTMP